MNQDNETVKDLNRGVPRGRKAMQILFDAAWRGMVRQQFLRCHPHDGRRCTIGWSVPVSWAEYLDRECGSRPSLDVLSDHLDALSALPVTEGERLACEALKIALAGRPTGDEYGSSAWEFTERLQAAHDDAQTPLDLVAGMVMLCAVFRHLVMPPLPSDTIADAFLAGYRTPTTECRTTRELYDYYAPVVDFSQLARDMDAAGITDPDVRLDIERHCEEELRTSLLAAGVTR